MYDAMIAPQINTEEYMHRMANPDANYEEAPDNYGLQIGLLMHSMIGI